MAAELIYETLQGLIVILLVLTFIVLGVVEYLKTKWGVEGKTAEIVSLVIGFIVSCLVAWAYAWQFEYKLVVPQWIALALFIVLGTISPSGGYKLLFSAKPPDRDVPG